jgi:hypothetical protein
MPPKSSVGGKPGGRHPAHAGTAGLLPVEEEEEEEEKEGAKAQETRTTVHKRLNVE